MDNHTNLMYLAADYLTLAAVVAATVALREWRRSRGLPWAWDVPVFAVAVVLLGGVYHRLAGLGHEAAHYTLLKSKLWNDLVGDWFCFFPILSTVHLYRLFHLAHHQYVNDPGHDPDLVNIGPPKRVDRFPMTRGQFVREYYLRALTSPLSFVRFQWAYLYVNTFGKGGNVYMRRVPEGDADSRGLRVGTILGVNYVAGVFLMCAAMTSLGLVSWVPWAGVAAWTAAVLALALLPKRWLFKPPFRQPYSIRFASALRLAWWTLLWVALARLQAWTEGRSTAYFLALWVLPMASTFPFFLLLRDVYQHANSEDDRITNTRVFRADPFTQWAVFVHGQGLHTPHHLFPAVPHYHLEELHALLKREHAEYAARVVECHGTFANREGKPTILDVLTAPRPAGGDPGAVAGQAGPAVGPTGPDRPRSGGAPPSDPGAPGPGSRPVRPGPGL